MRRLLHDIVTMICLGIVMSFPLIVWLIHPAVALVIYLPGFVFIKTKNNSERVFWMLMVFVKVSYQSHKAPEGEKLSAARKELNTCFTYNRDLRLPLFWRERTWLRSKRWHKHQQGVAQIKARLSGARRSVLQKKSPIDDILRSMEDDEKR